MKRKRGIWLGTVAATAVLLVSVYMALTPGGTALADRIVKFFAPEKRIDTRIEGGTETQNAALQGNTEYEMGYILYIDSERYVKESAGGVDYYWAIHAPEGFPPVRMEISQIMNRSAGEVYDELLGNSKAEYDVVEGRGQVETPVKGWALFAYDDGGGEAPYEDAYVVDNRAGGCFVIRCKMFREAAEGHGARFQAMLETFEVVKSSQLDTALPAPTAAPEITLPQKKLTWDDLAIHGVKLDTAEQEALAALTAALGQPAGDETVPDAGGTTRILRWEKTTAVIRNGRLYSLETTDTAAALPNGLRAGLAPDAFKQVLGEPREAVGALAWGVGSNDNLFAVVEGNAVRSVKVSLIE